MRTPIRIVILEAVAGDADRLVAQLHAGGYTCEWQRVEDEAAFKAALTTDVDLILADYALPRYTALEALRDLRKAGLDVPFIVVTGAAGEEQAVECLRLGATDYLLKDRLARLCDAVARALEHRRACAESRAMHQALQQSEARFRRLAENAPDIVVRYRFAEPRRFEYVSPAATAVTGYTPEEHYADRDLGRKLVHPDDRWMLDAMARGAIPLEGPLELRWIHKDGHIVWTEQRLRVVSDEHGTPVALEGILRDITQRKESQRAAQLAAEILERVASLVLVADKNGDIVYASPSIERLLGFTREEVLGQGWWRLSRRELAAGHAERDRIAAAAQTRTLVDTGVYEQLIVDKQGQPHWFVWEDGPGPNDTIVGVGHDITERKQAEEERRRLIWSLGERVKEANLLHRAARLLQDTSRSLGAVLRDIVAAIPAASQYPDITVARVRLADIDVCSPGYRETASRRRLSLGAGGHFLEVAYLDDTPFLPEEDALLESLAEMLVANFERRAAQQQLAESEAKYRALVEQMPAVTYAAAGPMQPVFYVSPQVEALIGIPAETFVNNPLSWPDRIHPDDRDRVRDEYVSIQERGGTIRGEYRIRHADGRVLWVRDEATIVRGRDGEPLCVQGVIVDITDRKRAEEDLKTSRQALQTIIDASPFAIIELDRKTRVKLWNRAAERMFGWTAAEVLGGENPIVPPEYLAEYRANWQGTMAGHRLVRKTRRRRKDGGLLDVLICVAPIVGAEGQVTSTVGLLADISEQTNAERLLLEREAHFRSLIENALDIIAVLDRSGAVTYVSPSITTVLGHAETEVIGTLLPEWLHPDDGAVARATLAAMADGEAERRALTVRGRHAEGSWRSLEMIMKARRQDGQLIVNVRDITDRESLEQQLRQSQKLEAIGRLAGGIAHDFNNMLTAILGYSELMLDRLPAESELRGDVIEIMKAGERAGALTHQLLAFSRKQVLKLEHLDLNTVVTDFQKMLARVIGEDVRLETRLSPAVGPVTADRSQLEQVLLNLAVNARDAMPRGGTLTVETMLTAVGEPFTDGQARLEPGRWVCLRIADTGCGMPPEIAARVFEPFFTTKPAGKGTGLGLATVYGIVAQIGGQIALESRPGEGATFRVYLPEVAHGSVAQPNSGRTSDRANGTETVLLVEDEAGIRKLIRKALEARGYQVLEAASGEQAVACAKRHAAAIDLLLTDIVMPGMSGVDLAQHLVVARPQLKVMHMSGFAVAAHLGRMSPNVTFVQKPFTVDALMQQVRQCLDSDGRRPAGAR